MRNYLLYAGLFILVFIVGILMFFPYNIVVSKYTNMAIQQNKLPVSYEDIKSGPFKTVYKNVKINGDIGTVSGIDLGDIKVSYSLLSAVTQKAKVDLNNSYIKAKLIHKKGKINADVDGDLWRISRLFNEEVSGAAKAVLDYDYKSGKGELLVTSSEVNAQTPITRLDITDVKLTGDITGNVVAVNLTSSLGTASGQVRVDLNNIYRTLFNIDGEGSFMGMKSKFSITGTLNSPQFKLR